MRLFLDEGVSAKGLIKKLKKLGHDVATVRQQGKRGAKDPEVWDIAQKIQRTLVAVDYKPFRIFARSGKGHHGLIGVKIKHGIWEQALFIEDVLITFLNGYPDLDMTNTIVIISDEEPQFEKNE